MTKIAIGAHSCVGKDQVTLNLRVRSVLSLSHIIAAAHFAKLSYNKETAYDSKNSPELFYQHRAYITGSIITAASYLEATINEFFWDVTNGLYREQLAPDITEVISNMWKVEVQPPNKTKPEEVYSPLDDMKPSILQKFQIALILAQKELYHTGEAPYQDVYLLIKLRNDLVHYKPEEFCTGKDYEKTFSKKWRKDLEKKIKKINPLADAGDCAFFPHKCLSYGCAKWAVESSIKFTDEFFLKLGLPSNLNEDTRAELNLPKIE